jgi:hypothetical protein
MEPRRSLLGIPTTIELHVALDYKGKRRGTFPQIGFSWLDVEIIGVEGFHHCAALMPLISMAMASLPHPSGISILQYLRSMLIAVQEVPFSVSGDGNSFIEGTIAGNGEECLVTGTITLLLFLSRAVIFEYRLSQP